MGKKSKRKMQEDPSYGDIVNENVSEVVDQQTAQDAISPNKRHKKHKKSKEDDQDIEENPAENHVHTEIQKTDSKKKKKKKKAVDDDNVKEEDSKPKKQKLQDEKDIPKRKSLLKPVAATLAEVGAAEAVTSENCVKKKKKKKNHKNRDDVVSMISPTDNPVNGSVSEPEKSLVIEMKIGDDGNEMESSELKKKKDKKKSKDFESANDESNLLESNPQGIVTDCCSEGKKHNRKHKEERTFPDESIETKADDSKPKKKKKHKTKSELHIEDGQNGLVHGLQENGTPLEINPEKEKKNSKKDSESKKKGASEVTDKTDVKKKKKDKKGKNSVNPAELTVSVCEGDSTNKEEKVSKKKKKSESAEERHETETAGNDETAETEQKKKKKKKRKSKDREPNSEQDATGDDSRVCSIDTGTADLRPQNSITINPGETIDDTKQTDTDPGQTQFPQTPTGQWGANMFKDSERQNKFLRLLGGFKKAGGDSANGVTSGLKKGLFGSLQHTDTSTGGQKALTYQAAQAMNRRLESDYERALNFSVKGQRGIGLGFKPDPAEGKKFYIDVNKVASKTFD